MATPPRIVLPGLPHHIVHRGNNRRRLFSYPIERWAFVHLLATSARRHGCRIHAAVLLDNHIHAVVTPPTAKALASFVAGFAGPFARRRNRARAGSGKLFEQSFFSRPLATDHELAVATAYVDLNRVRAGLVDVLEDDHWSTAPFHLGAPVAAHSLGALWMPSPWYLGLGRSPIERAARYTDWIAASEASRGRYAASIGGTIARSASYGRRLRRPDGSSAKEETPRYEQSAHEGPVSLRSNSKVITCI